MTIDEKSDSARRQLDSILKLYLTSKMFWYWHGFEEARKKQQITAVTDVSTYLSTFLVILFVNYTTVEAFM